jgi:hypothetical protein
MGGQLRCKRGRHAMPCAAAAAFTESPPAPPAKQNPNKGNTNLVPTLEQRRTQHQGQRSMIIPIETRLGQQKGLPFCAWPCLASKSHPVEPGWSPAGNPAALLQPLHSRANHRHRFYFRASHPRLVASHPWVFPEPSAEQHETITRRGIKITNYAHLAGLCGP